MFLIKKNESNELDDTQKRERLFFHDIINQTHGLILFLGQKRSTKKKIEISEIEDLEKEVRTLQSLIKDHFHFKHKNLPNAMDIVPFSVAQVALMNLIETYLDKKSVQVFIHQKGYLAPEQSINVKENALVNFPIFYRIMNNLIKNMAEAKSQEVHFVFDFDQKGFHIETRNSINSKLQAERIVDEKSQDKNEGLGLESIHFLSNASGGHFEFEIEKNFWVNRITLPKVSMEISANDDVKKAA